MRYFSKLLVLLLSLMLVAPLASAQAPSEWSDAYTTPMDSDDYDASYDDVSYEDIDAAIYANENIPDGQLAVRVAAPEQVIDQETITNVRAAIVNNISAIEQMTFIWRIRRKNNSYDTNPEQCFESRPEQGIGKQNFDLDMTMLSETCGEFKIGNTVIISVYAHDPEHKEGGRVYGETELVIGSPVTLSLIDVPFDEAENGDVVTVEATVAGQDPGNFIYLWYLDGSNETGSTMSLDSSNTDANTNVFHFLVSGSAGSEHLVDVMVYERDNFDPNSGRPPYANGSLVVPVYGPSVGELETPHRVYPGQQVEITAGEPRHFYPGRKINYNWYINGVKQETNDAQPYKLSFKVHQDVGQYYSIRLEVVDAEVNPQSGQRDMSLSIVHMEVVTAESLGEEPADQSLAASVFSALPPGTAGWLIGIGIAGAIIGLLALARRFPEWVTKRI